MTWFNVVDDVGGLWHGMLHMSILYTVLIPESANILHGSYWTHFESKNA